MPDDQLESILRPLAFFAGTTILVTCLAMIALLIAAWWMVFTKAGRPGWAAIIPIYNMVVMLEIIGRPWWWIFLYLIPLANLVFGIIVGVDLARSFGRSTGFGVGLALLSAIFYPILGFGSSRYIGPAARGDTLRPAGV